MKVMKPVYVNYAGVSPLVAVGHFTSERAARKDARAYANIHKKVVDIYRVPCLLPRFLDGTSYKQLIATYRPK